MNEREYQKKRSALVKAKISKFQFPERCPVCMEEAEDLVALTVFEAKIDHWTERRGLVSGWEKQQDSADIAMSQARGGSIFWVPTCLAHGSDTISTPKKKVISILGFMLLFYPTLYFVLGLIAAVEYDRPAFDFAIPILLLIIAIAIDILYGFYPRALEKHVKFIELNYSKDEVIIVLKNESYRALFLKENEMAAESLQGESTKTEEL